MICGLPIVDYNNMNDQVANSLTKPPQIAKCAQFKVCVSYGHAYDLFCIYYISVSICCHNLLQWSFRSMHK